MPAARAADSLAAKLNADGVTAQPYHAGLDADERSRNQELFLRDEVRVICATIAFGMGINKPNVRFVVHHDLPKNIEGYYQETGRAGRDGLPSECLLLFSAGDVVKQTRFIEEKTDRAKRGSPASNCGRWSTTRRRATAAARRCSRYFGEEFDRTNCGGCDNCLTPRETYDGTLAAQKFLSCVYRIREKSGFGVRPEPRRRSADRRGHRKGAQRGHDQLSTYGIGGETSGTAWQAIGRELMRLGLVEVASGKFATLQLTDDGRAALRERTSITLTKPTEVATKTKTRAGEIPCDEVLFDRLRTVRRTLADERDVPAYVIFSDVALREMARTYPTTRVEFRRIPGVGEQKLKDFAEPFLTAITEYLASNPRKTFAEPIAPPVPRRPALNDSESETLRRFQDGASIDEIARARGFVRSTIAMHLALAIESGAPLTRDRFFNPAQQEEISAALRAAGPKNLVGARASLGGRYTIDDLRIFRAFAARP